MNYPTPWQKKTIWRALTALSIVALGAMFVGLIYLLTRVVSFLQPILIPFAVAGVMAYLLDPVVLRMMRAGISRQRAVICVFLIVTLLLAAMGVWIGPALVRESANLAGRVPKYAVATRDLALKVAADIQRKYHVRILPWAPAAHDTPPGNGDPGKPAAEQITAPPDGNPAATPNLKQEETPPGTGGDKTPGTHPDTAPEFYKEYDLQRLFSGDFVGWLGKELPVLVRDTWRFLITSVGGFLGVFGFLLSFIIVPLYLFYFLTESASISKSWSDYLPIRASHFKDEVVESLTEINGYLIAFFRGQLLVSLINGTATGIGLVFVGLDFGLLIGLLLCIMGLIPYLGITLVWIPAVIIAAVQGGSWLIPASPWWVMPVVVSGIFLTVQQFDSWFVTPKIVGNSVGLHPMTVIFSVFLWSLLLGGLLGAILAVPLTATAKVLLKRYVWERQFKGKMPADTAGS